MEQIPLGTIGLEKSSKILQECELKAIVIFYEGDSMQKRKLGVFNKKFKSQRLESKETN